MFGYALNAIKKAFITQAIMFNYFWIKFQIVVGDSTGGGDGGIAIQHTGKETCYCVLIFISAFYFTFSYFGILIWNLFVNALPISAVAPHTHTHSHTEHVFAETASLFFLVIWCYCDMAHRCTNVQREIVIRAGENAEKMRGRRRKKNFHKMDNNNRTLPSD